jgi:hypothetical protein
MMMRIQEIVNILYLKKSELVDFFQDFYAFRYFWHYSAFFLLVNAAIWAVTHKTASHFASDDLVTLHYNVGFGINLIGSPGRLYTLPTLGIFICVFNIFLLFLLRRFTADKKFNRHFVLLATLLANLLILVSAITLFLANQQ